MTCDRCGGRGEIATTWVREGERWMPREVPLDTEAGPGGMWVHQCPVCRANEYVSLDTLIKPRVMHPLEEAVLLAFPDAHDITITSVGRRARCDFKSSDWCAASFVGHTGDVTPDMIRVSAIARRSKGVLSEIEATAVSAAVHRVEATVVPPKVYILTGTFGGVFSGGEVVGVYATREMAKAAAEGVPLAHIAEHVLTMADPREKTGTADALPVQCAFCGSHALLYKLNQEQANGKVWAQEICADCLGT